MRISNNSGKRPIVSNNTKQESSKTTLGLKKSEVLSDLFNNAAPKKEANGSVRVRISHTSKALYKDLRVQIKEFLLQNKEVSKVIEEIPIEVENGTSGAASDLTVRRLIAYHQWLGIQEQEEGGVKDEESAPFNLVQKQDKDAAIKEIFQKHAEQQKSAIQGHLKSTPSYYYTIYPETYSFN